MELDDEILEIVKDEFKSTSEIYKVLKDKGVDVSRDAVVVHIRRMVKYGEIWSIIGDKHVQGIKPPLYKKTPADL